MSFSSVVMIGGEPYLRSVGYVWDTGTLSWLPAQQAGGSGGGGAVTVANGADVAQGNTGDAPWVSGAGTVISLLKKIASAGGSAVSVADGADVTQGAVADATWSGSGAGSVVAILKALWGKLNGTLAVSGTFWQTTQPVSIAATVNTNTGLTQPLTDTQLRASAVPVSIATNAPDVTDRAARLLGHVTVDSAPTTAITATALPLPANAAQETGGNLASVATSQATLVARTVPGQAQAIASIPVVFALDQTSIDGRIQRQAAELATIEALDPSYLALRGRSAERATLADARGRYHRGTAR